jgi:hypothetical protein
MEVRWMDEEHEPRKRIDMNGELGISRRDLIRRGAIVGGTLVWVAPAIQSMAPKALAQVGGNGSACSACYCWTGNKDHPAKEDGKFGLATAEECDAFCQDSPEFPGQNTVHFEFCTGTDCDIQTGPNATDHGAFCS